MKFDIREIDSLLQRLFPICRSLTGKGNEETFSILKGVLPSLKIHEIASSTQVFDWTVPAEWSVKEAYVENYNGKRIIDFADNNLHLVSYSSPFLGQVSEEELKSHLHSLPLQPEWIPYRTSYYKNDWGFCCRHSLLSSPDFVGPFKVVVDTELNEGGRLIYGEAYKKGDSDKEILISTYCCHPSLANDNLSGLITATLLFRYLSDFDTRYSYRLVIVPETIGAICFLSQANLQKIIAGTVITTTAGPGQFSIKEAFDKEHWINQISHLVLSDFTGNNYSTYPFSPDGSDERQYSSPSFRIPTPSLHKSKYYEYDEYHTSADNLDYISPENLKQTLELYANWFEAVDSYCVPKRVHGQCEFQLGKRGLYPDIGGTLNQRVFEDNRTGNRNRKFHFGQSIEVTGEHLDCFHWIMHLADGKNSNVDITLRSGEPLRRMNEAIALFLQKGLVTI